MEFAQLGNGSAQGCSRDDFFDFRREIPL